MFTYEHNGRPGKMWNRFQEYLRVRDDENLSFQLGYLQVKFGMLEESVSTYRLLLDRGILRGATIDQMLVANLIDSLNRLERYGDAIDVFENTLPTVHLSGRMDNVYYNTGNSYLGKERLLDAIQCYKNAMRLRTTNSCNILHNLGNCYFMLKDARAALECYRKALEVAGTDEEKGMEEYAMGATSFMLGCYDAAREYYNRAAERGHSGAAQRIADMS